MWADAHDYLSALSSPLGSLVTDQGLLELEGSTNHFAHLVRAIVGHHRCCDDRWSGTGGSWRQSVGINHQRRPGRNLARVRIIDCEAEISQGPRAKGSRRWT